MFENSLYETELIESGIFPGEAHLKEIWLQVVTDKLNAYGYSLPDIDQVIPVNGGRIGSHTEYLQPLLDEMTEVFSIDPSADW